MHALYTLFIVQYLKIVPQQNLFKLSETKHVMQEMLSTQILNNTQNEIIQQVRKTRFPL